MLDIGQHNRAESYTSKWLFARTFQADLVPFEHQDSVVVPSAGRRGDIQSQRQRNFGANDPRAGQSDPEDLQSDWNLASRGDVHSRWQQRHHLGGRSTQHSHHVIIQLHGIR